MSGNAISTPTCSDHLGGQPETDQGKQLRVLLGDTPFYTYDPANPRAPMPRSDTFPAELIQREVIAKKRKALIVYGEMHYLRRVPPPRPGRPVGTIVSLLAKAGVTAVSDSPF